MANLITLARFLLLFVLVGLALQAPPPWQLINAPLLILIIALDGLDGFVARLRGEESAFGSIFDIVVDRIVENVLWTVLAFLGLMPIWVALLFVTRGVVVDSIRYHAVAQGETVFGMMRSRWGRILVSGRFMRGAYGAIKAATFAWLFLLQPMPEVFPESWEQWSVPATVIADLLVFASVVLCVARGVPVVIECLVAHGIVPRPKSARP